MDTIRNITEIMQNFTPITLSIAFIIYMFNAFINDFNVTSIEMKIMKPKKKFLMLFSKYGIASALFTAITLFFSLEEINSSFNKMDSEVQKVTGYDLYLLVMGIVLFLIILIVFYITHYFLKAIEFMITINYDYFIEDTEGSWLVLRNNSNNILVTQKKDEIKFFENPNNYKYVKKVTSAKWKLDLYDKDKGVKWTYWILFLLAIVVLIFSILLKNINIINDILFLILLCICIIIAVAGLIILNSKIDYDQSNGHSSP
ncbi:hypothetical protein [Lysinibacillus capsici]|uniref:hypothetical protein n=1 Tax=Lysinibacillus capsici TaxID=2115968 RepID=UPI0034E60E69